MMPLQEPTLSAAVTPTKRAPKLATPTSPTSLVEDAKQLERLLATRTEWRTKLAGLDAEIAAKQKDIRAKVEEIGKR
jgi:hypothetical protein